jgi:peroxiredoxin
MVYLSVLFILLSCKTIVAQTEKPISIKGQMKENWFRTVGINSIGNGEKELFKDSVNKNNQFTLLIKSKVTDYYKIKFDKDKFIVLILAPGDKINLVINSDDLVKNIEISGSPESQYIFENQKKLDKIQSKADSLKSKINSLGNQTDKLIEIQKYQQELANIPKEAREYIISFMKQHPTSLSNLFLQEYLPLDENIKTYISLDSTLYKAHPENFFVQNFHKQIQSASMCQIGSPAPDFTLADTSNRNFTFSSLKGKLVLIDFWASWCNPCMGEMPNVKKMYDDFHSKGLEIVGVSLDKSREGWLKAIRIKNLNWIQVSDLKFWQTPMTSLYNFNAIPFTVLVGPDGKIIAKNLRGEELYKKVAELLK